MKQSLIRTSLIALLALGLAQSASAELLTFTNNYAAWQTAAGAVKTVDFETLPNGAASTAGTPISASFNYTAQGVTLSSRTNDITINGNPVGGFGIHAGNPMNFNTPTNIRADLVGERNAFGIFFPGGTTLSVYDKNGNLLGTNSFSSGGDNFFMGFVSDTPIAYAISERRYGNYVSNSEYWQAVTFSASPVPEPETYAMLGLGLVMLAGARKLRRRR